MAQGNNVKLPPDLDIQSKTASTEWQFLKASLVEYLISTGQDESNNKVKLSLLRNMMGADSARILATIPMTEADKVSFNPTMAAIEKFVNPRLNEVFERYVFTDRVQQEGESFEHFLTDCRYLVKSCNYNEANSQQTPEDKSLRDRIVHGIRDKNMREVLLQIDGLTLEKAAAFCRTCEQSREQVKQICPKYSVDTIAKEVDFVKQFKKFSKKNLVKYSKSEDSNKSSNEFECRHCQTKYGP
jgi:hypothetical protein